MDVAPYMPLFFNQLRTLKYVQMMNAFAVKMRPI